MQCGILVAACTLVVMFYACTAHSGYLESLSLNAADSYYNLLVQGFRAGHLSLNKEVPPGFAQLPDPYDPTANIPYRSAPHKMHDMSYYKGRLYLGTGVTPALILFWPFVELTGHYLLHRQAAMIFCTIGFLASVGLLYALWRRYFAEVSVAVIAACGLALGLATGVPVLLSQADVYQVSISCSYMLTMLALGAIWCAMHEPERRCWWLAAASMAYGLAMGARPYYVGAIILLVPVAQAWRERRQIGALLLAATGPIILIGLGLMLYNALRFDSPFEFGYLYALSSDHQEVRHSFSLNYLWFNFRVYFLEPVRWSARFPFVHEIVLPPLPAGHGSVENPFGVLTNVPLVWLGLAVPLAWRGRSARARSILRGFLAAVALLFGTCALSISLYFGTCIRYEADFLPALLLLAVVGILGLERAVTDRPVCRRASLWGLGLLVGLSVAFNLLTSVKYYAEAYTNRGNTLLQEGRLQEAIGQFEQALRIKPDDAKLHSNLGIALAQAGRPREAVAQFERALQIDSDLFEVHANLGHALMILGEIPEAITHWEQALRIKPDSAELNYDLALAFEKTGKTQKAIEHYRQALKLQSGMIEARKRLEQLQADQ